jgi:hypothetical protein
MNAVTTPDGWWLPVLTHALHRIHPAPRRPEGPVASDLFPPTPPTWTAPRTGGVGFPPPPSTQGRRAC